MPPRRSCFEAIGGQVSLRDIRFNATTAFLLPHIHDGWDPAAMPFQCHHGVPASGAGGQNIPDPFPFQCHHGVPASRDGEILAQLGPAVSMPPRRSCFVFHLFQHRLDFPVSMPPRRSCFLMEFLHGNVRVMLVSMPPRRSCFALLRLRGEDPVVVSMPPRRSCFNPGSRSPRSADPGFNATTAFLLRRRRVPHRGVRNRFNATTAFLLPAKVGRAVVAAMSFNATTAFLLPRKSSALPSHRQWFQCHHGVPASLLLILASSKGRQFQCHHGVPASTR